MSRYSLLLALSVVCTNNILYAAEPTAPVEIQVRQTLAAMQQSFNDGNAAKLADCWTPEGVFVGPAGQRLIGREKIEGAFREYFKANPDAKLRLGINAWHQIAEQVVAVELLSDMTPLPKGVEFEPLSKAVFVKHDGKWLVGILQETVGDASGHHIHLKQLQWLVGRWTAQTNDDAERSMRCECDWNQNGNFLIRKYSVVRNDGAALEGTEIIGWDPREHRIRSWTFNSDGSFGQNVWTQDGQAWMIVHTGTLGDGSDLAANYRVTPVDADTITIVSSDRCINGEPQPPLPEITMKRCIATDQQATPIEPPSQVLPQP